jgi:hypothetical protein
VPLSETVERQLAHTRVVTCQGYERNDNLWDIEGRIIDTKPYRFTNQDRGGWIEADEALHDMSIRLTINIELEVMDADACIDFSPFNYCHQVSQVVRQLIGLKIAPGWTKKSKIAMGGSAGCTHLTELLGPVATTAIQTIVSARRSDLKEPAKKDDVKNFINTCHSYQQHSPVVKRFWPELYKSTD